MSRYGSSRYDGRSSSCSSTRRRATTARPTARRSRLAWCWPICRAGRIRGIHTVGHAGASRDLAEVRLRSSLTRDARGQAQHHAPVGSHRPTGGRPPCKREIRGQNPVDPPSGSVVYRLGRLSLTQAERVRLPPGLPFSAVAKQQTQRSHTPPIEGASPSSATICPLGAASGTLRSNRSSAGADAAADPMGWSSNRKTRPSQRRDPGAIPGRSTNGLVV